MIGETCTATALLNVRSLEQRSAIYEFWRLARKLTDSPKYRIPQSTLSLVPFHRLPPPFCEAICSCSACFLTPRGIDVSLPVCRPPRSQAADHVVDLGLTFEWSLWAACKSNRIYRAPVLSPHPFESNDIGPSGGWIPSRPAGGHLPGPSVALSPTLRGQPTAFNLRWTVGLVCRILIGFLPHGLV